MRKRKRCSGCQSRDSPAAHGAAHGGPWGAEIHLQSVDDPTLEQGDALRRV